MILIRDEAPPASLRANEAAEIEIEVPAHGSGAAARLVAAGFAARFGLGADRIDDVMRALDAALLHQPAGDTFTVALSDADDGLRVSVGPLAAAALDFPAIECVLSALVDEIQGRTEGRELWVDMRIAGALDAASR